MKPKELENLRYTECQGVNVSLDLWSDGMYVVFLESPDSADEDYIEFDNYEDALEEFEREQ